MTAVQHTNTNSSATTSNTTGASTSRAPIPASRIAQVELRKLFNTRAGFWLMMSVLITSAIATIAFIAFAPIGEVTFDNFGAAVGIPMTIVLPIMAVMSVSSEFSQRTALATFTLVPSRMRVIAIKFAVVIAVGVTSILAAVGIGAIGNLVGASVRGIDPVWDMTMSSIGLIMVAQTLNMAFGFMFGVLFRNSAAAIVAYMVVAFVLSGLTDILAATQQWFADIRGWVDFNYGQSNLFSDAMTGEAWAQLAVTTLVWVAIPMAVGLRRLMTAEVH